MLKSAHRLVGWCWPRLGCGGGGCVAVGGKEFGEECCTVGGPDSGDHFDEVVQLGGAHDVEYGAGGSCFWVPGTDDDAGDSCEDDGTCTHGAWFEGDYEGALVQSPGAKVGCGFPDREDFGVGGGVLGEFAFVVGCGDGVTVGVDDDCADGDVVWPVGA